MFLGCAVTVTRACHTGLGSLDSRLALFISPGSDVFWSPVKGRPVQGSSVSYASCLQGCGPILRETQIDSLAEKASMLQELKRMRLQVWQAVQEPWFLATSIVAAALGVSGRHLGGLEALTLSTGDPPQLAIVLLLSLATLPGFLAAASYHADWSEARSLRWSFAALGVGFSLLHPGRVPSVGEEGAGDWAHLTDGILSASAVGRGLLLHLLFASFAQALACIGRCCLGAVPKGHVPKQIAWRPVALAVAFCAFFCDAAAARIFESRSRWLTVASANFLAAVACASFPQSSRRPPPLSEWAEGYAGLRDLRLGRQRLDSRDSRDSRLRAGVVGGLRRLSARFLPARKKDLLDPAFVNCILAELWPSLRGMLEEDVVKGEFQQILQNVTAALKFDRICLGPEPLKVLSLSMVPATTTERAITIAAEVEFCGKDVDLTLSLTLGRLVGLSVSVNRFSLRGSLLLSFRYLTPHLPLTQGLTIAFVNPPAVDLSLRTPAGSLPFLPERARQALIALVDSTLARDLVLPNRLPLPFGTLWPLERLQHARPEGVLFCRVLGACGVTAERSSFGAERAVRCCLSLGAATWRSVAAHSEDGELIWDEQPTFVVDAFSSQELRIALHECHTFSDRQSGQVKALPLEELVERSKHQHMPSWALQAAGSASGSLGSPQILLSAIFHPVSRQRASFDKKLGSLVMITVDCARRIPDAFAGRRLAVRAFLATRGRPANGDRPAIQSYSLRASYVLPLHAATGILERLLLCNFAAAPTSSLGDSSDEDPHGTKPYQGYLKSEEARWRDRLSNLWSLLSAEGRDLAEWLDSDRAGCIKSIALILDLPVWAEQRLGEVMDEMRQAQFAARRVWARRRGTAEAPVTVTRALECCWRQQLRLVASSPAGAARTHEEEEEEEQEEKQEEL
ncbi:esyt3 [Symbiodinium microadriaticum]|nr:esyt3 [Symbiodinium microadriaticum]